MPTTSLSTSSFAALLLHLRLLWLARRRGRRCGRRVHADAVGRRQEDGADGEGALLLERLWWTKRPAAGWECVQARVGGRVHLGVMLTLTLMLMMMLILMLTLMLLLLMMMGVCHCYVCIWFSSASCEWSSVPSSSTSVRPGHAVSTINTEPTGGSTKPSNHLVAPQSKQTWFWYGEQTWVFHGFWFGPLVTNSHTLFRGTMIIYQTCFPGCTPPARHPRPL